MSTSELSNEFDILYNNITSNQAPGLNGYEKSVLLTQAQESLFLDIYNGKYNNSPFESTEEVTSYINTLVKQVSLNSPTTGDSINNNSVFFELPDDLWFITYESVLLNDKSLGCKNHKTVIVKPVTQDEFYYTNNNPFRSANDKRVLRLTIGNKAELVSKYNIESYNIRYISKLSPIIVEDLSIYNTSINGITEVTECKLNPASHRMILNIAVKLAKSIWESGN